MEKTLLDVVEKRLENIARKWDGWNYKVIAPKSLDDSVQVIVILTNKDKTTLRLTFNIY